MATTFQTGELQVIGRRLDSYDFVEKETNQQVKGETSVLVCWDPSTLRSDEVKIKTPALGLFEAIPMGDHIAAPYPVRLSVEVFARNNKTTQTAVGITHA